MRPCCVEVITLDYRASHGAEPRGPRRWEFSMGVRPLQGYISASIYRTPDVVSYAEAKRAAIRACQARGIAVVYVCP